MPSRNYGDSPPPTCSADCVSSGSWTITPDMAGGGAPIGARRHKCWSRCWRVVGPKCRSPTRTGGASGTTSVPDTSGVPGTTSSSSSAAGRLPVARDPDRPRCEAVPPCAHYPMCGRPWSGTACMCCRSGVAVGATATRGTARSPTRTSIPKEYASAVLPKTWMSSRRPFSAADCPREERPVDGCDHVVSTPPTR